MNPYYDRDGITIYHGDCRAVLASLPEQSVQTCVTSPPYFGLRDYGVAGQIGLEPTPDEYVAEMVTVFQGVRRVLKDDGTLWLNLGDSYAGSGKGGNPGDSPHVKQKTNQGSCVGMRFRNRREMSGCLKPKDLIGIPWRVAFALQADGWYLRSEIIWAKPNGMPSSQQDRCTSSHETIFLLSKSATYFSDFDAIKTPPRESTLVRLAQDVQAQAGSHRANGGAKTNGTMKAVGSTDKQRGHSRTHAGFNDRWDAMEKAGQQSKPAMMRDVWFVAPGGFDEAHFAVMPEEIARRCVLAGAGHGGVVLDPFNGSGTTGEVARHLQCEYIGIELNESYCNLSVNRWRQGVLFNAETAVSA